MTNLQNVGVVMVLLPLLAVLGFFFYEMMKDCGAKIALISCGTITWFIVGFLLIGTSV